MSKFKCEFIALVTGSGSWGSNPSHDVEGALNEVKNRAADIGAIQGTY